MECTFYRLFLKFCLLCLLRAFFCLRVFLSLLFCNFLCGTFFAFSRLQFVYYFSLIFSSLFFSFSLILLFSMSLILSVSLKVVQFSLCLSFPLSVSGYFYIFFFLILTFLSLSFLLHLFLSFSEPNLLNLPSYLSIFFSEPNLLN